MALRLSWLQRGPDTREHRRPVCVSRPSRNAPETGTGARAQDYGIIKFVCRVCNAVIEKKDKELLSMYIVFNVHKIAAVICNSINPLIGFN